MLLIKPRLGGWVQVFNNPGARFAHSMGWSQREGGPRPSLRCARGRPAGHSCRPASTSPPLPAPPVRSESVRVVGKCEAPRIPAGAYVDPEVWAFVFTVFLSKSDSR